MSRRRSAQAPATLWLNPTAKVSARISARDRATGSSVAVLDLSESALARLLGLRRLPRNGQVDARKLAPGLLKDLLFTGVLTPRPRDWPGDVHFHNPLPRGTSDEKLEIGEVYLQAGSAPAALGDVMFHEAVSDRGPAAWVRDPGTQMLFPHSLNAHQAHVLADLLERRRPEALDAATRGAFAAVGILCRPGEAKRLVRERKVSCTVAKRELLRQEHTVLRNLIPVATRDALRTYVRALDREGYLGHQDGQEELRHFCHNEPVMRFVHHQLAGLINRVAPEPIKPSYAYLASYQAGSRLRRHTDRAQCAWNLSLVLDNIPDVPLSRAWPIYLQPQKRRASKVLLDIGDGVLYRGTDIPHWRNPLSRGRTMTACFFHFVPTWFNAMLD